MRDKIPFTLLAAVLSAAAGGCVRPGEIDVNLVNRYQRAMVARGAQRRRADTGLESLRPVKGETGPELTSEGIMVSKVVESVWTHKAVGKDGQRVRIQTTRTIKTVSYQRDPNTQQLLAQAEVNEVLASKVVRTTTTHEVIGERGPRKRVRVTEKVETIDLEHPLDSEQPVRKVHTETSQKEILSRTVPQDSLTTVVIMLPSDHTVETVPETFKEVDVYRVGQKSRYPALVNKSRRLVHLSLDEAILRALANSLEIRVVSFDPAISREDMVRAAAVFDYTLFGAFGRGKTDRKSASQFTGEESSSRDWSLGVRQRAVTGASWSLEWRMTRSWDSSTFTQMRTNYEPTVVLQVSQPLLRDAWPEFNLSQVRIARLNSKITDAQFRSKVEEVLIQQPGGNAVGVIDTYWQLVQARRVLRIKQRLLAKTRRTFERVKGRERLDATRAAIKQVEAEVKIRQAELIRARAQILNLQDVLARLLADTELNSVSRCEVVPTTPLTSRQVKLSPTEQLLTALRHSPLLAQARLAIAASAINVAVAENQRLPELNFTTSVTMQGLGENIPNAYHRLYSGDYPSYTFGLTLDYPLGNRDREALLRQQKYRHTQSIVAMQNAADQIATAVTQTVRAVETAYEEISAYRAVVEAARIQLQALTDTEEIRGRLTPEFLRTKLDAQRTLANAEEMELNARVNYSILLAELSRTTGTILELHRVRIARSAGLPVAAAVPASTTTPAQKPSKP